MRKQGQTGIISVFLVVAGLFFLPSLLTFQPVLSVVQSLLSRQVPGTLSVASCSVGWVQGLRCEQLSYHDPVQGLLFKAPQLASDKGLLLLLVAPSYLGEITLNRPLLSLKSLQPASPPPPTKESTASGPETLLSASDRKIDEKPSQWERLALRLNINEGQLIFDRGDQPARQLAHEIDFSATLAMGSLSYDLRLLSPQQPGYLQWTGFVNLPVLGQSFLETLVSRSEVVINDFEIAGFLDFAASRSKFPQGKGLLTATLHLETAGMENFEVQGKASLHKVQLTGGVLGEEQPTLDQLSLTFEGSHRAGEKWQLSALDVQSEPAWLQASGNFDGTSLALTAKGGVDLPFLAAQMPHLLGLHTKTRLTEGTADFSFDLSGSPEALLVRANGRTDRLSLLHDGQPYSWSTPLVLKAEVDYGKEKIAFRTLHLLTPFFEAKGSGGLDDFTFQGGGDLEHLFQELGKIFALTLQAKGQAQVSMATKKREDGRFTLESRIAIEDFALSHSRQALSPGHDVLVTATTTISSSPLNKAAVDTLQVDALQVDAIFGHNTLSLHAEDMQRDMEQTQANCTLKGTLELEHLTALLQDLGLSTFSSVLQGRLHFDGTGECEGATVSLHSLGGTVEQLALSASGHALQEPQAAQAAQAAFGMGRLERVYGRKVAVRDLMVAENWLDLNEQERPVVLVDFDRRRLEVRRLGWTSAQATLMADWLIEDWRQANTDFSAALRGEVNAALLTNMAKAEGWLAPDLTINGRAQGSLTIDSTKGQGRRAELALQVEDLAVVHGKKRLFADPRPVLAISLHDEMHGSGEVNVPSFFLQTAPLTIKSSGLIARTTPLSLRLQGQLTPASTPLAPLLRPIIGREMALSANQPGDFLLSLPLSLPLDIEHLTFKAQLPLKSLRFREITLPPFTLPVDMNRGRLQLFIDGQLNGGQTRLAPSWNFALQPTVMSLPPASQLFKDVSLKPPLVRGLLGRMHPLFGAMAQAKGVFDLQVDNFSVPIQRPQCPVFSALVALDRLTFNPTGALRELLTLGGFDQQWFRCKERELRCEGKDGRVVCDPVHLLAGQTEIRLRGQMNPDGSLHYRVRLPVRQPLADKAHLVVHGEPLVEAEIGGTRNKPSFDSSAFLAGLSAQLRQDVELTESLVD